METFQRPFPQDPGKFCTPVNSKAVSEVGIRRKKFEQERSEFVAQTEFKTINLTNRFVKRSTKAALKTENSLHTRFFVQLKTPFLARFVDVSLFSAMCTLPQ
ncbi:MAG: hypothetical protein ACXV7J_16500 [Methylomonas sp.]